MSITYSLCLILEMCFFSHKTASKHLQFINNAKSKQRICWVRDTPNT